MSGVGINVQLIKIVTQGCHFGSVEIFSYSFRNREGGPSLEQVPRMSRASVGAHARRADDSHEERRNPHRAAIVTQREVAFIEGERWLGEPLCTQGVVTSEVLMAAVSSVTG